MIYQLCLLEHIPDWQSEGWEITAGKIVNIGGWFSVWMKKESSC